MFTPNEYGLFSMPTLETPRLILRRMTMKDAKDIFEYSRDEEVACHVLWSAQRDIGEAKDYCRYCCAATARMTKQLGHHDRQTRHLVGTIGYMVTAWITQVWKSAILWLVGFGTAAT